MGQPAAGITDCLLLGSNRTWGVGAKGHVYKPAEYPEAFVRIVSDGYIRSMGMQIVAGRDLSPSDGEKGAAVILVNRTLARALWPKENCDREDHER